MARHTLARDRYERYVRMLGTVVEHPQCKGAYRGVPQMERIIDRFPPGLRIAIRGAMFHGA